MYLLRSILLAYLSLLVLVNGRKCYQKKIFSSRSAPGFGKRSNFFPGYGNRQHVPHTGSVPEYEKDNRIISQDELQSAGWNTKSGSLLDWNAESAFISDDIYSDYPTVSERNMESVLDYSDPEAGYIARNSGSLRPRNIDRGSRFLGILNKYSDMKRNGRWFGAKGTGLYNDPAQTISEAHGRQKPISGGIMELALLLKKFLGKGEQERYYSDLQLGYK